MLGKSSKKTVKKIQYSELVTEELYRTLNGFKEELQKIRFQLVTGSFKNTSRVQSLKKEVARILTEIKKREIIEKAKAKVINSKVS